ncbi:DUF308 domain-containing protein [Polymorphospora sp. NPDC050346]|uniref:DUF308 domain-containing protein n=1 Tax=Polymorphospora sp. NPDC050346 TaxID=3155780 RepID=UPI0033CB9A13
MSAGGARRGRRDNGFDAAEYAVAGDVDPRVGEHLLDVLAAGGIAAYLQPSADLNPVTRTTTVPARPVDRLYVDRTHLETARGYLADLAEEERPADSGPPDGSPADGTSPVVAAPAGTVPAAPAAAGPGGGTDEPPARSGSGRSDPDVDAEWARIVAGYHTEIDDAARSWPAAEDVGPERPPTGRPRLVKGPVDTDEDPETGKRPGREVRRLPSAADFSGISVGGRDSDPSLLDGLDTFGTDLPDDDEGYEPPPPPPLPRVSKYAVVAVLAMIGGFALFLFPDLLPIDRSVVTMIGFLGILGGFVTLIARLRSGDDEEDRDDGAIV